MPGARGGHRGRPRHRPRADDGHGHDPGPVRARGLPRARRRAGRAGEGGGRVGRGLRAAARAAPAGGAGAPGRQERPGLLSLPAARRGLRDTRRSSSTRAATSRSSGSTTRPRIARAARDRGARHGVAVDRGRRREGDDHRLAEPGAVLRGRRHQGVHVARRGRRPRAAQPRARAVPRLGEVADHDHRGGQRPRVRRRLRDRDGVRRAPGRLLGLVRPAGDQPRASSRASAAPSGCRAWSARRRRWR